MALGWILSLLTVEHNGNGDGDGKRERENCNMFILAKQQLCTFSTLFCTFLFSLSPGYMSDLVNIRT